MRGVDERPEIVGLPIAARRREERDAVVAPVAVARKVGDRHQLDRGDPEILQIRQALDDTAKRPLWRERADVQLVEDGRDRARAPSTVHRSRQTSTDRRPAMARARRAAGSATRDRERSGHRGRRGDSVERTGRKIGEAAGPVATGFSATAGERLMLPSVEASVAARAARPAGLPPDPWNRGSTTRSTDVCSGAQTRNVVVFQRDARRQ